MQSPVHLVVSTCKINVFSKLSRQLSASVLLTYQNWILMYVTKTGRHNNVGHHGSGYLESDMRAPEDKCVERTCDVQGS